VVVVIDVVGSAGGVVGLDDVTRPVPPVAPDDPPRLGRAQIANGTPASAAVTRRRRRV